MLRTQQGLWLACWELWGHSPFEVVLEATAFSLTSVLVEHFPMAFSAFFLSVVVELWDWASIMSSHYFSWLLKGMPIKHHSAIKFPKWQYKKETFIRKPAASSIWEKAKGLAKPWWHFSKGFSGKKKKKSFVVLLRSQFKSHAVEFSYFLMAPAFAVCKGKERSSQYTLLLSSFWACAIKWSRVAVLNPPNTATL